MTVRTTTVKTMPPVWTGSTTTHACAHLITQVTIEGDTLMPMCLRGGVGLRMSLREHGFLSDILEGGGRQRPPQYPPTLEQTPKALPPACAALMATPSFGNPACWRLGREVLSQLGLCLVLEICPPHALLGAGNAKLSKTQFFLRRGLRSGQET